MKYILSLIIIAFIIFGCCKTNDECFKNVRYEIISDSIIDKIICYDFSKHPFKNDSNYWDYSVILNCGSLVNINAWSDSSFIIVNVYIDNELMFTKKDTGFVQIIR